MPPPQRQRRVVIRSLDPLTGAVAAAPSGSPAHLLGGPNSRPGPLALRGQELQGLFLGDGALGGPGVEHALQPAHLLPQLRILLLQAVLLLPFVCAHASGALRAALPRRLRP